ncbi:c-type cytochrome [Chryseobacterium pennipullorum]|uniref:Cytochrome C n=1 Tax=Chryseobacterium pennipullorum TaxID=2258963 RepID=A0A3D9B1H9_9FLAO|nr:c-type cytochrome [Chryseobacterium pennipullorum]REC47474.1 cytochrome C [Chryseobacterium pennipullorum]
MKALVIPTAMILIWVLISMSCSGKNETTPIPIPEPSTGQQAPQPVVTPEPVAITPVSDDPGFKLIEGADCLACHKIDAKVIGPSYQDVAAKYTESDIDQLAQKIIEGGKGNWGDIPMTPHEGLSKDNAKQMVKYILSLKK